MSSLDELYQSVILDHNRAPRNYHPMAEASCTAEGNNPLCGDQLRVWVRLEDGVIADVSFQGAGCAISQASASLMTQAVKGKTREQALELFNGFHGLVTGAGSDPAALGKLAVFRGVSQYPIRVKCASLGWHTLKAALERADSQITTE